MPEVAPEREATAVNGEHNLGTFAVHTDEDAEEATQSDSHEEKDRP
jgi:hypothetical protein